MKKTDEKTPVKCICGRVPVIVRSGGKRMVSCSAPNSCSMRTGWLGNESEAVGVWNTMVETEYAKKRARKRGERK